MRRLAPALLAASLFLAACSDVGNQAPTPTEPSVPEATLVNPPGCPTDAQMAVQIHALFPKPLEGPALIRYAAIRAAMIANRTTLARQLMYATVDWTLKQYNAGSLIGGKSTATQAKVTTFINSLYCIVGLTAPTIPPGALGSDGLVAVVSPSTSTTPTTLVTESKFAGIQIAGNAVTQPTLITVSRSPDTLLTQLDKYPLNYEFHATPELPGTVNTLVGVCVANGLIPLDSTALLARLRVAHNVPDPSPNTIDILPLAEAPFLDCTQAVGLGPNPTLREFASWGLAQTGRTLKVLFSPAPLSASLVGQTGLGGTTKKLSPFGVVDTLITVSARSPTTISGVARSSVPADSLPSVKVSTPKAHPVVNYSVAFSVPSGSEGSITGGAATTNGSGIATVGSWTLGSSLGTDLVNATVAPPHPRSGVLGSPVSFSATVTYTLVSYLSSGYAYKLIGNAAPPTGWETTSYSDASSWPVRAAAFGSGGYCSLDGNVQTAWPVAGGSGVSDLLLRKSVSVPAGWTGSLSIAVAIDNDVQVFFNGEDITGMDGGFQTHEGCATAGSSVFTVPNTSLHPGASDLIAVRARDRGVISYFDMEVKLVPTD